MKLINSSPQGQLAFCPCKRIYFLEFGNVCLRFQPHELKNFLNYITGIDAVWYCKLNQQSFNKRKLLLNTNGVGTFIALNRAEFFELRNLLLLKNSGQFLHPNELLSERFCAN